MRIEKIVETPEGLLICSSKMYQMPSFDAQFKGTEKSCDVDSHCLIFSHAMILDRTFAMLARSIESFVHSLCFQCVCGGTSMSSSYRKSVLWSPSDVFFK